MQSYRARMKCGTRLDIERTECTPDQIRQVLAHHADPVVISLRAILRDLRHYGRTGSVVFVPKGSPIVSTAPRDYLYVCQGGLVIRIRQTLCDPLRISTVCQKHAQYIQHMGSSWGNLIHGIWEDLKVHGATVGVTVEQKGLPGDGSQVKEVPPKPKVESPEMSNEETKHVGPVSEEVRITIESGLHVEQGIRSLSSSPKQVLIIEDQRHPLEIGEKEAGLVTIELVNTIVAPLLEQFDAERTHKALGRVRSELLQHLPAGVVVRVDGYPEGDQPLYPEVENTTTIKPAAKTIGVTSSTGQNQSDTMLLTGEAGSAKLVQVSNEAAAATYSFGDALKLIKGGSQLHRSGWNGAGMWVELKTSEYAHILPQFILCYPKHSKPYPDGAQVAWAPSQTDLLADDWKIRVVPC